MLSSQLYAHLNLPRHITLDYIRPLLIELSETTPYNNIKEYDCIREHNTLYNIFQFTNLRKGRPSLDIHIDSSREILSVSDFSFCTMKNDTCVSDSLRSGVLFEKFIMAFLSNIIPPNKNMLDIGSNIGIWSIVYSNIVRESIYAFEPQPEIFKCLETNVLLNNCTNVKVYNFGLSDSNTCQNNFGAFRICDTGDNIIQVRKGDDLGLTNIGFIKMDVEGHELKVIEGLEHTIRENLPIILIEIHKTDSDRDLTLRALYNLGYTRVLKLSHCDCIFIHTSH